MTFAPNGGAGSEGGGDPSVYGPASRLVAPSPIDIEIRNTGAGSVTVATVAIPVGNNRHFDLHFFYSIRGEDGFGVASHMAVQLRRDGSGTLSGAPIAQFGTTSGSLKGAININTDDVDFDIPFTSSGDTDGDLRIMLFERPIPNVVIP